MKTRTEKGFYAVGASRRLEWLRIGAADARTLVFIPPLIGGNHSQPAAEFRFLVRRGCGLFSFNYAGHGNSSGKFSLGRSIEDTGRMLSLAASVAGREGLALAGIGMCYSAIPLLHAIRTQPARIGRLVLISAVPALDAEMIVRTFCDYVRNAPANWNPRPRLSTLPQRFGEFMLPGVYKSRSRFGVLTRKRAQLLKIFCDLILDRRFKALEPVDMPALCLYGSNDRILQMFESGFEDSYESRIRQICRQVRFRRLCGDHHLQSRTVKKEARRWIASFLTPECSIGGAGIS